MLQVIRVTLVLITLLCATGAYAQSLADTPIAGGFSLELPTIGSASAEVAEIMLRRAGVPYGIEQAPPTSDTPRAEIGTPIKSTVRPNEPTIRQALNHLVAFDPRYEWIDAGDRILFRAIATRGAGGLLRQRIPQYVVHDASPVAALEALLVAIAPDRPAGGVLTTDVARGRPVAYRGGERLTLAIDNATTMEILNAIVKSIPSMSWRVRYGTADASAQDATIALLLPDLTLAGTSAAAWRASAASSRDRLLVSFMGDLRTPLASYARQAHIVTGFEAVPGTRDRPIEGKPPLDLTDLKPAEALARITALDPRYALAFEDGVLVVRPLKSIVDGTPLDLRVREFRARDETVEQILRRVVALLGGDSRSVTSGVDHLVSPRDRQFDKTQLKRVEWENVRLECAVQSRHSFTLRDATVRQILNTLCRLDGAAFWQVTMQPHLQKGLSVVLMVQSWVGWFAGSQFNAPPWEPGTTPGGRRED
jgi:hypothetical protein